MFKKIKSDCAICSEGFSVQVEFLSLGGYHVRYAERSMRFLADADDVDFGDRGGVIVHSETLRRLDDPYPAALFPRDRILQNIDRALDFLEIDHQIA